jgi:acyl-CoA reductase-like NAD-dependent aldehyde dehydrogenase
VDAATKVTDWIAEAEDHGAKRLVGGDQQGALIQPCLLESVAKPAKLACEEVFGPVATLDGFDSDGEAIERINDSAYGIQAGVFTHNLSRAERYFRELEMGGVVIGDTPALRFDNMPYGGVKRSGFGREGVLFAMEEMTDPKAMVLRWTP